MSKSQIFCTFSYLIITVLIAINYSTSVNSKNLNTNSFKLEIEAKNNTKLISQDLNVIDNNRIINKSNLSPISKVNKKIKLLTLNNVNVVNNDDKNRNIDNQVSTSKPITSTNKNTRINNNRNYNNYSIVHRKQHTGLVSSKRTTNKTKDLDFLSNLLEEKSKNKESSDFISNNYFKNNSISLYITLILCLIVCILVLILFTVNKKFKEEIFSESFISNCNNKEYKGYLNKHSYNSYRNNNYNIDLNITDNKDYINNSNDSYNNIDLSSNYDLEEAALIEKCEEANNNNDSVINISQLKEYTNINNNSKQQCNNSSMNTMNKRKKISKNTSSKLKFLKNLKKKKQLFYYNEIQNNNNTSCDNSLLNDSTNKKNSVLEEFLNNKYNSQLTMDVIYESFEETNSEHEENSFDIDCEISAITINQNYC